jgi:hypothetical protein
MRFSDEVLEVIWDFSNLSAVAFRVPYMIYNLRRDFK